MRNKDLMITKIEQLEGKLEILRFLATRGEEINEYLKNIDHSKYLLEEIKSSIEREEETI